MLYVLVILLRLLPLPVHVNNRLSLSLFHSNSNDSLIKHHPNTVVSIPSVYRVMSSALPPVPTIRELLSLASHIPRKPPPVSPIADALEPFVSLCNQDWIRNFIFTSDAIELSHLVSPTLSSTAFTCTLSTTHVAPPTVLPDPFDMHGHGDNHHMAGHYLFVPAFNANGATLGFGALDALGNVGDVWVSNAQLRSSRLFYTFRFVRDTTRKIMLEVFDLPEDGIVVVFFARYLSSTITRSCHCVFLRRPFLEVVKDPTMPFSVRTILPALLVVNEDTQWRPCPYCRGPANVPCGCTPPTAKPAHPFDVGFFAGAMTRALGEYQGLSTKRSFWHGVQTREIALGSRFSFQAFVDPSVVLKLSSDAVTKLLFRLNEDPRQCVMLEAISALRYSRLPASQRQALLTNSGSNTPENITSSGGVDSDPIAETSCSSPSFQLLPSILSASDGGPEDEWWSTRCYRQSAYAMEGALVRPAPPDSRDGCLGQTVREGTNITTTEGTTPISMDRRGNSNACTDPKVAERRRRAAERRERNRAAARRSNLRTKAIRDGLLSELKTCHEKVEQLRAREVMLRQENLQLRQARTEQT